MDGAQILLKEPKCLRHMPGAKRISIEILRAHVELVSGDMEGGAHAKGLQRRSRQSRGNRALLGMVDPHLQIFERLLDME